MQQQAQAAEQFANDLIRQVTGYDRYHSRRHGGKPADGLINELRGHLQAQACP